MNHDDHDDDHDDYNEDEYSQYCQELESQNDEEYSQYCQYVESQEPIDPDKIAQYIADTEFGFVTGHFSWCIFMTCKKIENPDGTITYLESIFDRVYYAKPLPVGATRYILSPRLYASLEEKDRKEHKDSDTSWTLRKQTSDKDKSWLYRMRPERAVVNSYANYLYVKNMTHEKFLKHVDHIGGIPCSSFYII